LVVEKKDCLASGESFAEIKRDVDLDSSSVYVSHPQYLCDAPKYRGIAGNKKPQAPE